MDKNYSQEIISELHANGMSYTSIAVAIGRSRSAIMSVISGERTGEKIEKDLMILLELSSTDPQKEKHKNIADVLG